MIPLPLLDIAQIEEAGGIARITLESLLKILPGLVESSEMAIRDPHGGVGAS